MCTVLSSIIMTKDIARVHLVQLMNADWAPDGRQPSDQANRLGLWVRRLRAEWADTIHFHYRCYYLLSRKADTHFIVQRRVEGWVPEKTFPGQSLSRTRRFTERRFPDKTFPRKTFPGGMRALTRRLFPVQDVSRTITFPNRRFPDRRFTDNLYK